MAEEKVDTPATMIASVLLGPGTKITHGAMRLLADSGTSVCWVGENGVRMYAHGVSNAQTSRFLLRQAYLVSDNRRRLAVAREMYAMRFPGEDVSALTMQQLRGREGARVRRAYRLHSTRTGVPWQGRRYVPGQPYAAGDDVNRVLSALNSCLYGVCHAAVVGLGASPALGFVHTGNAISFVLDIADLYKATTTIPLAFDLTAEGAVDERTARTRLRDVVLEQRLLATVVGDVRRLLLGETTAGEAPPPEEGEEERVMLWDPDGDVAAGRSYDDGDATPAADWSVWEEP
jgi:CRISPR-associated protein Cas1